MHTKCILNAYYIVLTPTILKIGNILGNITFSRESPGSTEWVF